MVEYLPSRTHDKDIYDPSVIIDVDGFDHISLPPCMYCTANVPRFKMRGGRQYVHYERQERRVIVCTGGDQ